MRSYALRKTVTSGKRAINASPTYSITVPGELAERVPEGVTFAAEWHPDGILLRAVRPGDAPEWTTRKTGEGT